MRSRHYLLALTLLAGLAVVIGAVAPRESKGNRPPSPLVVTTVEDRTVLRVVGLEGSSTFPRAGEVIDLACRVLRGRGRAGEPRLVWQVSQGSVEDQVDGRARLVLQRAGGVLGRARAPHGEGEASGVARLNVRVPQDGPEGFVRLAADRPPRRAEQTACAALAKEAARHRHALGQTASFAERAEIRATLYPLATLLQEQECHDAAFGNFAVLRDGVMRNDPDYRNYAVGLGRAAYTTGRTREAMTALQEAGPWRSATDEYLLGDLLERAGRNDDAIARYTRAWERDGDFPEPLFRAALLRLARGDPAEAIVALLLEASPRIGATEIDARLGADREFSPLEEALERSGRRSELREARPLAAQTGGRENEITSTRPEVFR